MQAVEQHIDEGLAAGEEEGQEGGDPARGRQAVHGRRVSQGAEGVGARVGCGRATLCARVMFKHSG